MSIINKIKKARVIYNPKSGKELLKKYLPDILNELENLGYEASAFATTAQKDSAKDEARRVAKAGFDLIVAAGGDGTINEIVNGIAPLKKRPKMAIIPAGTTNDYARALKIPRENPVRAIELLRKQQTLKTDIGKAGDNYFINIAAAGGLTELTFEVPSELKTMFGYLAYLAKGVEMLPRIKPLNIRLTHDEGVYEGKTSMFFVALTNSIGGFERLVPDALLDDGKFTLLIIKSSNIIEIMRLLALMLNDSKHLDNSKVIYLKTNKLKVEVLEEKEKLMLNLDGEYGGDAPITMRNLYRHIEFFADMDEINNANAAVGCDDQEEIYEQAAKTFVKEVNQLTQKKTED